jgi:dCMP deaminase
MGATSMSELDWRLRFMGMAELVATWSKDPSTKVGAVLVSERRVLGLGYNGFPRGCSDDDALYQNRDEKYRRVVHAEVNALLNAQGKHGSDLTLYSTLCPCSQCTAMAINYGVTKVVSWRPTIDQVERWGGSFKTSKNLLEEAKIPLLLYNRD